MSVLRVLLVADTHLGFDLPARPRVERRRRGPDFFANFERALAPALRGEVDLVVHGGDLLFRSKVRRELVYRAFEPLVEVVTSGVPVVLVPGNHERSAIPFPLLAAHRGLEILDRPRTVRLEAGGCEIAIGGFPCERDEIRGRFTELVRRTGCLDAPAGIRLLTIHQTVEGARVGPVGYTFRDGTDVVRGRDVPEGLAAVLAGHIHRGQVLTADLSGRALAAPVLYPGSIERTSSAERHEPKGYMTLEIAPDETGGRLASWTFHELPARPMVDLEVRADGLDAGALAERIRHRLAELDPDAVVRLAIKGELAPGASIAVGAARLRELAPATMTLTLRRPRAAPRLAPSGTQS